MMSVDILVHESEVEKEEDSFCGGVKNLFLSWTKLYDLT